MPPKEDLGFLANLHCGFEWEHRERVREEEGPSYPTAVLVHWLVPS